MIYQTGDIVEGKVTGIQPYGAFVSLEEGATGLIHISEISEGFVRDISRFVQIGETVRVKVIEFDETTNHAKLSLKALQKTNVRNRKRNMMDKPSMPPNIIGFHTIAMNLPRWIDEAERELLQRGKKS